MKAIHNLISPDNFKLLVVLYPKDTEKWKQFTTMESQAKAKKLLCCIPKILKNESNSQRSSHLSVQFRSCVVSQRYWKMKAIHNYIRKMVFLLQVVLYPKDTEKWKQFTTMSLRFQSNGKLCCIPKILKNESNSQLKILSETDLPSCVVSQRYWKMKAIHNLIFWILSFTFVVLYPKDTEKWKQFTTIRLVGFIIFKLCCIPKILKNESNSQRN